MPSERSADETLRPTIAAWLPYSVILFAHLPLLYVYFQQLWSRPHYQFFPLVLLASGYLSVERWAEREAPPGRSVLMSRLLLLASIGLLTVAIARLSPFIAYVSTLLVIGSFFLRMGVPAWGPWLLLFLMVRIPYGQDVATIQAMQRVTTGLSGTALDSLGVEHFAEGNVLVFPSRSLFVEEACSGVVSMLAMIACAAIMAAWWRRSVAHGLLLMLSGIFWAGAMNVIRVVGIAIALAWYGVDLTEGWRHAASGLVAFAVSLAALLSTDRLLLFALGRIRHNPLASYAVYAEENWLVSLFNLCLGSRSDDDSPEAYGDYAQDWDLPPDAEPASPAAETTPARPITPSKVRPWEWALTPVFLLLGAAQVVAGIGPFSAAPEVRSSALALDSDDLPKSLNGWEKVDFKVEERTSSSAFGEHSRIWTYRRGNLTALLSLDFVFPEWHALTACYQGIGWELESQGRVKEGSTPIEAWFTEPDGDAAYLIYDLFDSRGRDYLAPDGSFLHPQLRRIASREVNRFTLPSYYQVQLLVTLPTGTLSPEERRRVQRLFADFEAQVKAHFVE